MTGFTGYTGVVNGDDMQGPSQITAVYEHFDPLIGETVDTAASLPSTGNWVGRTIYVQDVGSLRTVTALPNTWSPGKQLADVSTFGTGWAATNASEHKPRLRMSGSQVFLFGAITRSTGAASNMLTVPTAFQPPSTGTRFIGSGVTSTGLAYELSLSAGVVGSPSGYGASGAFGAGATVPLMCSWWMD